jgi:molybdenum cofactor cytidylyltransferase
MGRNKLTIEINGKAVIAHVVEAALAARLEPVVVVTGFDDRRLRHALTEYPVIWAHNPHFADGMSSSLRTGLGVLPTDVDAVLVCLGDMPAVRSDHLERIRAAFDPTADRTICVPVLRGQRGNPVLLGRRHLAEMLTLAGDRGARQLLALHRDQVYEVEMDDDAVLTDLDTADALAAYVGRQP